MGAMENWGLVTYRTTAVLFDEGKSDTRYKNRIAYVVAHGEFLGLRHNDCVRLFSKNEPQSWPTNGLAIL
jgi:hypothetical protein